MKSPLRQTKGKKQTETGFTHGEFSARLAEANGFNAIRVQQNGMEGKEISDFSKSLNGIADQIDSGKLKLGKGDVINVNLGQLDPSFEQINKLLGSNKDNTITPENVKNPETQKISTAWAKSQPIQINIKCCETGAKS